LGYALYFFLSLKEDMLCSRRPPPLNLAELRMLISKADLIAVGEIDRVKETKGVHRGAAKKNSRSSLELRKITKGVKVAGKAIVIRETYKTFDPQLTDLGAKDEGTSKKMIVSSRAGPSCYHGKYRQGMRIVVLLEKIKGTDEYRPLGPVHTISTSANS